MLTLLKHLQGLGISTMIDDGWWEHRSYMMLRCKSQCRIHMLLVLRVGIMSPLYCLGIGGWWHDWHRWSRSWWHFYRGQEKRDWGGKWSRCRMRRNLTKSNVTKVWPPEMSQVRPAPLVTVISEATCLPKAAGAQAYHNPTIDSYSQSSLLCNH